VGLNPADGVDICLYVFFLSFVKVAASVTSWSLVQMSYTACVCLNVCELRTSTMRRSRSKLGCCTTESNLID